MRDRHPGEQHCNPCRVCVNNPAGAHTDRRHTSCSFFALPVTNVTALRAAIPSVLSFLAGDGSPLLIHGSALLKAPACAAPSAHAPVSRRTRGPSRPHTRAAGCGRRPHAPAVARAARPAPDADRVRAPRAPRGPPRAREQRSVARRPRGEK